MKVGKKNLGLKSELQIAVHMDYGIGNILFVPTLLSSYV